MAILEIKKVIQELIIPELHDIKSDMRVINARLDSLEREMNARFDGVDKQLNSLQRQLDTAIDIHERLATLEAKINR